MKKVIRANTENEQSATTPEIDNWEDSEQEFSSEKTSINSNKLPAIFRLIKNWASGTLNLDYGGGKFDNASEYLAELGVTNLIYDKYNRSSEHNNSVITQVRQNGGADTSTLSNVLNVIKEKSARIACLKNIRNLLKPSGVLYVTVYEGSGSGEGKPTSSGYQRNLKTEGYLEEIQEIFPSAYRKGKLIICPMQESANSSKKIEAGWGVYDYPEPPDPKEYLEKDDVEDIIDFEVDDIINVDEDGEWDFETDEFPWLEPEYNDGTWSCSEYPSIELDDESGVIEKTYELLEPFIPGSKGRYRIRATVTLSYTVSGVEYEITDRWTDERHGDDWDEEVYTDNAEVEYNEKLSTVENFRFSDET